MKIAADRERCIGSGMCALTVPQVFGQNDEDGRVVLLTDRPEPQDEAAVRTAVAECPVAALLLRDPDPASRDGSIMTKDIENFIGVYRVINELGSAIDDRRWQDFASHFADDAKIHHPILGEIGAEQLVSSMRDMAENRIASHYLAGNIRIQPSDGDSVHASWDFRVTLVYPGAGEDPLVLNNGVRFNVEFRHIAGRWRIADLTNPLLWMDPEMSRYFAAKMASFKLKG